MLACRWGWLQAVPDSGGVGSGAWKRVNVGSVCVTASEPSAHEGAHKAY